MTHDPPGLATGVDAGGGIFLLARALIPPPLFKDGKMNGLASPIADEMLQKKKKEEGKLRGHSFPGSTM